MMIRAVVASALLAAAVVVHAQSQWPSVPDTAFTVSPVRLDLAPGARATSVTVSNGGPRLRTVQVQAFRWTQEHGEDRYTPDPGLVVNPPLFRLAPGGSQIVRAGFRSGAPAGDIETAYRLYFQEVDDAEPLGPNQLRLLLRIGIPLFVAPGTPVREEPRWSADGDDAVQLANTGNRHLRITGIQLRDAGDRSFDVPGFAYVLAGQTFRWALPAGATPPIRIVAQSEDGAIDVALASH